MKKLIAVVIGLMFAVGMVGLVIAGSLDAPGSPSAGSGMYTLSQIYDYMNSGIDVTPIPAFQEPGAAPGPTMKTMKDVYDDIKAKFIQCNTTAVDVKSGQIFFCTLPGIWGVQTGTLVIPPTLTPSPTPTITPTRTPTIPPTPSAGGEWVLVPGNPSNPTYEQTGSFYVMKYEAKNVGGSAYSQAGTAPWVNINLANAGAKCSAIGAHLCTVKEAQTINRNLEKVAANWIGSVGSGVLKRGNVGDSNPGDYDGPNPDYDGAGTGSDRTATSPARMILSGGQEIWDWSGNVREWITGDGTNGCVDSSGGVSWPNYATADWCGASPDLSSQRSVLGPSACLDNNNHGFGIYEGASSDAYGFLRGGHFDDGSAYRGQYNLWVQPVDRELVQIGFRCCH